MNLLHPKIESDLHKDVLPWLTARRDSFLGDQTSAGELAEGLIEKGLIRRRETHARTLQARIERKQKEEQDLLRAGEMQAQRRADRKIAREKREKEQAKQKMRDEIRRILIEKCQVASPVVNTELLEPHGCYERGKQFMGALGGQLQQIYYVVNAILKLYPAQTSLVDYHQKVAEDPKSDQVKNARSPRELMMERFFVPFLLTSLKELKCEHLQFLMQPEMERLVTSFKLPKNSNDCPDFTKLTQEQYMQFRHALVTEKMHNATYAGNQGVMAMELILTVLCMVLCNKIPKGVVPFRVDPLINKIKLVSAPRGIELATRTEIQKTSVTAATPKGEQEVVIEKNTNERAVVRILVPKRTMTLSEINAEKEPPQTADGEDVLSNDAPAGDGEQAPKEDGEGEKEELGETRQSVTKSALSRQPSERIVEQDQEDKAIMIASKVNLGTPYQVYVLNQFAARAHRVDFIEQIKRGLYDWFQDNPRAFKKI